MSRVSALLCIVTSTSRLSWVMTICWHPAVGLSDDGGTRGMSEVTRSCLWRVIMVTRLSLRAVVARLERARRIREGREGEGEPTRRRSQGGITNTLEMLTTEQRQLRAGSWHYNKRAAVCSTGTNLLSTNESWQHAQEIPHHLLWFATTKLNPRYQKGLLQANN